VHDRLNPRAATVPFVVSSVRPDSPIGGLRPGAAWVSDLARMFRELGVQFLRASVVRMGEPLAFLGSQPYGQAALTPLAAARGALIGVNPGRKSQAQALCRAAERAATPTLGGFA
jgi:hypothetical protein